MARAASVLWSHWSWQWKMEHPDVFSFLCIQWFIQWFIRWYFPITATYLCQLEALSDLYHSFAQFGSGSRLDTAWHCRNRLQNPICCEFIVWRIGGSPKMGVPAPNHQSSKSLDVISPFHQVETHGDDWGSPSLRNPRKKGPFEIGQCSGIRRQVC